MRATGGYTPYVTTGTEAEEHLETLVRELEYIQEQYNVSADEIRYVFGFNG